MNIAKECKVELVKQPRKIVECPRPEMDRRFLNLRLNQIIAGRLSVRTIFPGQTELLPFKPELNRRFFRCRIYRSYYFKKYGKEKQIILIFFFFFGTNKGHASLALNAE